nr:hypothetical protein [Tanacetum cinerariifolium]
MDNHKKIFLMYPRFLMVFLNNQIELGEPFNDVYTAPAHTLKGKGSGVPTEPQPTPFPTHPSTGDQPSVTESSSSHDTTQDSMDSLEGTNRSEGDQVQSPYDSPLSGGHTSELKDAQAAKIIALKARIKKLEKRCKPSISHHRAWLKGVQRLSTKKKFGKKESVSKQGRKKDKPTLDDSILDDLDADHGMDIEEPMNQGTLIHPLTTTSIFDDEDITMAQTLIKMKEEKAKEKRVLIKDIKDTSRPVRSILTLKPLPTIDPKDKGKVVLEEPELAKKMTRRIEADALFAAKLQQEEREESRPPTKSQLRNLMMTYLKNMGGYKYSQLKAKTFVEIQGLYKRQKRVIDDFKPMDSYNAVEKEKVLEEPDNTKIEVKQEGDEENIMKRPCRRLKMKATKKTKRKNVSTYKKTLEKMLALRLIAEYESEAVFDLLRFIQKQIDKYGSHDGNEKDLANDYGKETSNPFMAGSLLKTT